MKLQQIGARHGHRVFDSRHVRVDKQGHAGHKRRQHTHECGGARGRHRTRTFSVEHKAHCVCTAVRGGKRVLFARDTADFDRRHGLLSRAGLGNFTCSRSGNCHATS